MPSSLPRVLTPLLWLSLASWLCFVVERFAYDRRSLRSCPDQKRGQRVRDRHYWRTKWLNSFGSILTQFSSGRTLVKSDLLLKLFCDFCAFLRPTSSSFCLPFASF